jgi:hypothetical protein
VRNRRLLLPLALAIALLALPAASQASFITGIGDEQASMFASPLYQKLHVKIGRYIAPYDVADDSYARFLWDNWHRAAQALRVQPIVAFYHSERTPTHLPSVATYQREVRKFIKAYPDVKVFQPYNEANRGNVPGLFSSPSAAVAARYYLALKAVCNRCQIAALDVLDGQEIGSTITYIRQFESALRGLHAPLPSIWGLHNYSDTNRNRTSGTRAVLAAVPGEVWLTETGGVVKFGRNFPNNHGEGLTRAANALKFMFKLATLSSRIKRLYIFQWTGAVQDTRFDAGLIAPNGKPRPGYFVVCDQLIGRSKCRR